MPAEDVHEKIEEYHESFAAYWQRFEKFQDVPLPRVYRFPSDDVVPLVDESVAQLTRKAITPLSVELIQLGYQPRENGDGVVTAQFIRQDGGTTPIIHGVKLDDFAQNFRYRLSHFLRDGHSRIFSPEVVRRFQSYYQVAAAITAGLDSGSVTARSLHAAEIVRILNIPDPKIKLFNIRTRNYAKEALDNKLQRMFGLRMPPSKYLEAMGLIDAYVQDEANPQLVMARSVILDHPEVFMGYLVHKIVEVMERKDATFSLADIDKLERLCLKLQEANVNKISDRNDFVYSNINDAIVFLQDLWISKKYPYAYAIANETVIRVTNLPHSSRFNGAFATYLFNEMLVRDGIVNEKDLNSGSVVLRAGMKSASSLITEVLLLDDTLRSDIYDLAERYGIPAKSILRSFPIQGKMDEARRSLGLLNAIIYRAIHSDPGGVQTEVKTLVERLIAKMEEQNDFVRCRIYVDNAEQLDSIINTTKKKSSEDYTLETHEQYPSGIGGFILSVADTPHASGRKVIPFTSIGEEYGINEQKASEVMIGIAKGMPPDASLYLMAHLYFPVRFSFKDKVMRLVRATESDLNDARSKHLPVCWAEAQTNLFPFEGLVNLHRLLFNRRIERIDPRNFPLPLNRYLVDQLREWIERNSQFAKIQPIELPLG